jgi:hypothetical protein
MATNERTTAVAFRLPATLVERVDAYAAEVQASASGRKCSRTDATRELLIRGLDATYCRAEKAGHVCTLHAGHAGTHYDSTRDKSWK